MKNLTNFILIFSLIGLSACNNRKTKSNIEIQFTQDTLAVGYTYWWPQSGPFLGNCGDELSLVFEGTVAALKESNNDPGPLYISQKGTIEIETVFKIKDLSEKTYSGEKFFTTDCFNGLDLIVGDKVLVFCHNYEGDYTISGSKSILKVDAFGNDLVASTRKYIDGDQNPLPLKNDMKLWTSYGLNESLQQVIDCEEETEASDAQTISAK